MGDGRENRFAAVTLLASAIAIFAFVTGYYSLGDLVVGKQPAPFKPVAVPREAPASDERAVELEFWRSISNSRDTSLYREYLRRYPNGEFATVARKRINEINVERVLKAKARPDAQTPPTPQREPAASPAEKRCVTFNNQLVCE